MVNVQRDELLKIPVKQFSVLLLTALILSITDRNMALSVILGGVVAVVPQLYLTICAFRYSGARASREVVRGFYRGESGKFLLTLVGFALIFLYLPWIKIWVVFTAYIAMQVLQIGLTAKAIKK